MYAFPLETCSNVVSKHCLTLAMFKCVCLLVFAKGIEVTWVQFLLSRSHKDSWVERQKRSHEKSCSEMSLVALDSQSVQWWCKSQRRLEKQG